MRMVAREITYAEAKRLVIERLRTWLAGIPVAERPLPRIIVAGKALSIPQLIREVEMDTPLGKRYVADEMRAMGYVIR